MIRFECDYTEGCIPEILEAITKENHTQLAGYSTDPVSDRARQRVKDLCQRQDVDVHFLVGGTQTNTIVIASALRPHQGVISAEPGHINAHETGAIEATGHKVLALPSETGRLNAAQIDNYCADHWANGSHEHIVQPGMVYLSHPAENGSLYSLAELEQIAQVCKKWKLHLFVDGARLGYALASPVNDITIADLARLTDAFYIGGTKVGALFGEAVVLTNDDLKADFRYLIKQHGGMLAKGWLLGLQFDVLFDQNRYLKISQHAVEQALRIKELFASHGCQFFMDSYTNQQFPILENRTLEEIGKEFSYEVWAKIDETHTAVRFCTSWATTKEQVDSLIAFVSNILAKK